MIRGMGGWDRWLLRAVLCGVLLAFGPAARGQAPQGRAAQPTAQPTHDVPVRVRVLKGSRQGPAKFDPRLADLKHQLSRLAYVQWDQVDERQFNMLAGKTEFVELPGGDHVGLTVQQVRGQSVTFEVALASRNTESRLTVGKGQRIVHQVTGEKDGAAFFVTVMAWPK